jgi:adenylate cyclase
MKQRPTTVLAADIVGYSRLVERDETATLATLRECYETAIYPRVAAHHGRVFKTMGDGFFAEFPSVADAVDCGREIQRAVSETGRAVVDEPLAMRMGIHVGTVTDVSGDLTGHSLVLAARLESVAWPNCLALSADAYKQLRSMDVEPLAVEIRPLKNLVRPVRIFHLKGGTDEEVPTTAPLTGLPFVAVLPFRDLSPAGGCAHITAGFSDDIVAAISRFRTFVVLARSTASAYASAPDRIERLRAELEVDYVLEGSICWLPREARIGVELVDTVSTGAVWAERWSCRHDSIFEVQDEIVNEIAARLLQPLRRHRLQRIARLPTRSFTAYDYWLRGSELLYDWRPESDAAAVPFFKRAIELDPSFARPYAGLAGVFNTRTILVPGNPTDGEDRARAYEYAKKAVELDPSDPRGHIDVAWSHMLERRFPQARTHLSLALDLNRNDTDIAIAGAQMSAYLGEHERASALAERAFRLAPIHPSYYLAYRATIDFLAGRYAQAADTIELVPSVLPEIQAWRAAALAHLGREEAKTAADLFRQVVSAGWAGRPDAGDDDYVRWFLGLIPLARDEERKRLQGGLRACGLLHEKRQPGSGTPSPRILA